MVTPFGADPCPERELAAGEIAIFGAGRYVGRGAHDR